MANSTKKTDPATDEKFEKVVQHFLNTPPKPHKPKKGKAKKETPNR